MTVSEWIFAAKGRLAAVGVAASGLEAQVLAGHVLLRDRTWLMAHGGEDFPEFAGEVLLQRRERHEPLAYILGYREFFSHRFLVNPSVLIPRQDTEILVEVGLRLAPSGGKVLDVGTGSGCIAISIQLERPDLTVLGLDVSSAALEVAERNASDLGAKVEWVLSDRFAALGSSNFELILSNPPYIGREEVLDTEVREFEPSLALFAEEEGLEFYRYLALHSREHLKPMHPLAVEVGYNQAATVTDIFQIQGWTMAEAVKDLAGIDRVLVFR